MAGWRDPESEDEFEALVRHAERARRARTPGADATRGRADEDDELSTRYNEDDFEALVRDGARRPARLVFHHALEHVAVVISDGGAPAAAPTASTRATPSPATTSTTGS